MQPGRTEINENACYNVLHCLQGGCIPKLLSADCSVALALAEKLTHCLVVLSWAGKEFGGKTINLPKRALLQARIIVQGMHMLGVVHCEL
jgi:hypothetical protein